MSKPKTPNLSTSTIGVSFGLLGSTFAQGFPYTTAAGTIHTDRPAAIRQATAGKPMDVTEQVLNAKLEAVEARTETKFAQLLGEMKLIGEKITSIDTRVAALDGKIEIVDGHTRAGKRDILIAVVATGIAVAALIWGGVQIFQSGLGLSASAFQAGMDASEVRQNDNAQGGPRKGKD